MNPTAGQKLKQTRLDKKLSLEQAAQQTHIRIRFLEALENDDAASLPSKVQAKGFIRLYTGYLGLPAEPILDLWEGKTPLPPEEPKPTISGEITDPGSETTPNVLSSMPQERTTSPVELLPLKKSDEFFVEIGRRLRTRREGLGLSLADIERHAHIREHHLRTLEEGRIDDLPSTVQGRGMLVNYSNFLGLEDNDILALFAEGLQARRVERSETIPLTRANPESNPPRPFIQLPINIRKNKKSLPIIQLPPKMQKILTRVKRFITPDLMVGTGLVVVLLGFVIWSVAQLNRPADSSAYSTDAGIISSETPLAEAIGTDTTLTNTTSEPATTQIAGLPFTATIPAGTGPVQVYIIIKQRAWLQVIVDGSVKFKGRAIPGNAYAFSGTSQIEVQSGNAAALQIFYNQNPLGSLGKMGDVLALTFTRDTFVTATPFIPTSIAPTPTATNPPSTATLPAPTPSVTPLIP